MSEMAALDQSHAGPAPDEDTLVHLLKELREVEIYAEVNRRLKAGDSVTSILAACQEGLRGIGEYYQSGRYFITGLVMGSEIMRGVYRLIRPFIESGEKISGGKGLVILGTIAGDIHDIGKNMFASTLDFMGFELLDLGVDVAPEKFQEAVIERRPDVVAISVTLTSCFRATQVALNLIRDYRLAAGLAKPALMVGGCSVTHEISRKIGADYCLADVISGLALCREVIEGFKKKEN